MADTVRELEVHVGGLRPERMIVTYIAIVLKPHLPP
jgi:hypothetical protein